MIASASPQDDASIRELLAPVAQVAGVEAPEGGWDASSAVKLLWELPPDGDPIYGAGRSRGDHLVLLRDGLDRLGAATKYRTCAAWKAGRSLLVEGRLDDSRRELERAIQTYERGDVFTLLLRLQLAELEQYVGDWTEAYDALEDARDLLDGEDASETLAAERRKARATWHGIHGQIDLMLGLADRARPHFELEKELAREFVDPASGTYDPALRLTLLDHEFLLQSTLENFQGAQERIDEALADPEGSAWLLPQDVARLEIRRAIVLYERERRGEAAPGTAPRELERALERTDVAVQDRLDGSVALAKMLVEGRDPERARRYVEISRQILRGQASAHGSLDTLGVELDAFDSALARISGADAAARREALEELESSFEAFLRSWSAAPRRPGGIAFLHFADRYLVLSELAGAELDLHGREAGAKRALEWIARAHEQGNLARDLGLAHRGIDATLSAILGDRSGLLLFLPGRQHSLVFLADRSGVAALDIAASWRILATRESLDRALAAAVREARAFGDEHLESAVSQLAEHALPPAALERILRWEHMTVIGEESFGHLPLECVRARDGRRLGEIVAISYAPSLPVAAALADRAASKERKPPGGARWRVVAAPAVGADEMDRWDAAPITLASGAWPSVADVSIGERATREAVLDAGASGVDALQVFAHGIWDSGRERASGLLLARGNAGSGALWPEDLELARAAPRVVLLGACGAARKLRRRGDDGRIGLAASFVLRGSDCVVTTTGDLELESALEFFARARARLDLGESPASALRSARAELGPSSRVQDHLVYAWGWGAAPIVEPPADEHGTDDQGGLATERPESTRHWTWVAVAALATAVAAFVLRRASGRG